MAGITTKRLSTITLPTPDATRHSATRDYAVLQRNPRQSPQRVRGKAVPMAGEGDPGHLREVKKMNMRLVGNADLLGMMVV